MNSRRLGWVLVLAMVASVLYLARLDGWPLQDPDEGRYAEIPREMLESGDFVTPRLNYVDYFEKPPLLYWLVAGSFLAFGQGEGAARLPLALSGLITLGLTLALGVRLVGFRAAMLGVAFVATSPLFFALSQVVLIDPLLTTCTTAALAAFWMAHESLEVRVKQRWAIAAAVAMALGVLAKGPVALVLVGAIAVITLAVARDATTLRQLLRPAPLLAFLAIAAPWFALLSWRSPHFARFFFVHEHFERFTGSAPGHHPESIFYYAPVLVLGTLPWSLVAAAMAANAGARAAWTEIPRRSRVFLLTWVAVIVGFFTVASSKLAPYMLPAFPALGLLFGAWVDRVLQRASGIRTPVRVAAGFEIVIGGLVSLVGVLGALAPGWIAAGLGRELWDVEAVAGAAVLTGPALLAAGGAAWVLARRDGAASTWAVWLVAAGLGVAFTAGVGARDTIKTSRRLAAAIAAERQPGDLVVFFRKYFQSAGFYLGERIVLVGGANELSHGISWAPDRDQVFWPDDAQLEREWASGRRIYVITNADKLADLDLRPPPRLLVKDDGRVVVTNVPAPTAPRPGES